MFNTFSFQDEFENEFWIQFKLLVKNHCTGQTTCTAFGIGLTYS